MAEEHEKLPIYTLDEVRAAFNSVQGAYESNGRKWVGWNTLAFALCPRKAPEWRKLTGENWSPGYDRWHRTVFELGLPTMSWRGMRLIGMPDEVA